MFWHLHQLQKIIQIVHEILLMTEISDCFRYDWRSQESSIYSTPRKTNVLNLEITQLKSGKSSEPSTSITLHHHKWNHFGILDDEVCIIARTTVDGSEIPRPTTWHVWNPCKSWEKLPFPQLVIAGVLPSTITAWHRSHPGWFHGESGGFLKKIGRGPFSQKVSGESLRV